MNTLNGIRAIIWKDLASEFRTKELLSSMLIFAVLTIIVFVFAFDPTKDIVRQVFPGMVWVCFLFAGILGLNRSFVSEKTNDCITGLILCPVDRSVIYFGKMTANLIYISIVEIVTLPLFAVLFNYRIPLKAVLPLVLVIFLGSLGFIAVGTFLSALSANARSSEILLPVILFPIMVPVILGAVQASAAVLAMAPAAEWISWIKILAAFDAIFLAIPLVLFEYILEV
ncbi:MAG: transcriptional regulator [Firmicutes bacterium HGW-Firmicutes-14]|nr:MAG: transcriptional regulator [Firmicutes bacterium HGW-Firmicutes-14]